MLAAVAPSWASVECSKPRCGSSRRPAGAATLLSELGDTASDRWPLLPTSTAAPYRRLGVRRRSVDGRRGVDLARMLFEPSVREVLVSLFGNGPVPGHCGPQRQTDHGHDARSGHRHASSSRSTPRSRPTCSTRPTPRYALGEVLIRYANCELPSADTAAASGQLSFGDDTVDAAQLASVATRWRSIA